MTTPTPEILCPDCGHSYALHNELAYNHPEGCSRIGCSCTAKPKDILLKVISQTRRAALLEAAKAVCWYCREGEYPVVYDERMGFVHHCKGGIGECNADPIYTIVQLQEQTQSEIKS